MDLQKRLNDLVIADNEQIILKPDGVPEGLKYAPTLRTIPQRGMRPAN